MAKQSRKPEPPVRSIPFPFPLQMEAKLRIEQTGDSFAIIGHNQNRIIPRRDVDHIKLLLHAEVDKIIPYAVDQKSIEIVISVSFNTQTNPSTT